MTIVPPPPKASGSPQPGVQPGVDPLPQGPILYHVEVTSDGGRLAPVAEIAGDSLNPIRPGGNIQAYGESFIAEHLRQGAEFALFRDGARAGTFVTQSAQLIETACGPSPVASGALELSANALNAPEFLALAKIQAPQIPRRPAVSPESNRTMRVLAPILADNLLRARSAPLPGNWERAMAQLRPFAAGASQDAAFSATFLMGDTLGPGLDDEGQSLFFIGIPANMGYDTVFVSYRDYASGGKSAPRVIDALDWNRDDVPELLLRVYGTTDTWFEAVGRASNGKWRQLISNRCIVASAPADTTG